MKIVKRFNVSTHTSSIYIILFSYEMEIVTKLMLIVDAFVGNKYKR